MKMHKGDGLIINKYIIKAIFLLIIFIWGCSPNKKIASTSSFDFGMYIPNQIKYDTIEGTFFYENLIEAYIEVDAIVKGSGFVKDEKVSETAYEKGYFIDGVPYSMSLSNKGTKIRVDTKSIASFYDTLIQRSSMEGTLRETKINPYCGTYYKKFEMKLEVLFIDSVVQRVPYFISCVELNGILNKKDNNNYQMKRLPTYAITKIFSWKEL